MHWDYIDEQEKQSSSAGGPQFMKEAEKWMRRCHSQIGDVDKEKATEEKAWPDRLGGGVWETVFWENWGLSWDLKDELEWAKQ